MLALAFGFRVLVGFEASGFRSRIYGFGILRLGSLKNSITIPPECM